MDTIELLETIGSDASLRYAAADELKDVLERARADAGFVNAVVAGDCSSLEAQFARPVTPMSHVSQTSTEEDEPGAVEEEELPEPAPREPQQG